MFIRLEKLGTPFQSLLDEIYGKRFPRVLVNQKLNKRQLKQIVLF
jgi:hypothetical protein